MLLSSLRRRTSYHQQLVVTFRESLEHAAFLRAIQLCFARHASIMAGFEFHGRDSFQRRIRAPIILTTELGPSHFRASADSALKEFLAEDISNPLSICPDEPAWRSTLLRQDRAETAWIWSHHHALCDASSYPLLLGELLDTYDRIRSGQEPQSAIASPDFLDHLAWLEEQDWTWHQRAWASRFRYPETPTSLPKVQRRVEFSAADGDLKHVAVTILPRLQLALKSLSTESKIRPSVLVLAATALWLSRVRDEGTIILAAMRSTRKSSIPGAESIIGLFANTVPLRIEIPEETTVRAWLGQVQRDWHDLRPLEQCSLAQVMEWTGLATAAPVLINFQRARLSVELQRIGLSPARWHAQLIQRTDMPLTITGYEKPELEIEIVWNSAGVDDLVAMTAVSGLSAALTGIVQNLDRRIELVDILSDIDRAVLHSACDGLTENTIGTLAHHLIDNQVSHRPTATAIAVRGREISYRELAEMAEHVRCAIERLTEPKAIVALILPPGFEIVCSMLGTLKAGRPFFIINAASPSQERNGMLRRVGAAVAITAPDLATDLRLVISQVCDFAELTRYEPVKNERGRNDTKTTDLAYLVHTSGSTGEKKFVEVEHASLANALEQLRKLYGLTADDRRLARASPGTDYFISEVLVTLAGGATLVLADDSGPSSLSKFLAEIRSQRITAIGVPASYWHEWVRAMTNTTQLPPTLKLVITGMEKINPSALLKWRQCVGEKVRWLNVYGPAETTLIATAYELSEEQGKGGFDVPIGRPLPNSRVYVLDHALRQMPVGITGELCISGLGVARGYRGDKTATAEKFVTNPFAISPGFTRLYRTGDYGYVDDAGRLIFSGRRDFQVKVRGHRVELGEIEAVLELHNNVEQAVVTFDQTSDERSLVAHVIFNQVVDVSVLRGWLKQRLPFQFQPASFVVHDRFPLLPSGKVDRLSLAADFRSRLKKRPLEDDNDRSVPGTLNRLWIEALGIKTHFGSTDNFFEVGGDSLSAVRLLSLIEEKFNRELSIHDLLTNPTIEALSRVLESKRQKPRYTSIIPLNAGGLGTPLFIVHGWNSGVFHTLDFARSLQGARPVYGVQAVDLAGKALHESFEEMADHYATEIMQEVPMGPIDLLGHSVGGMIAYATACELVARRHQVGTLFIVDTIPSNVPLRIYLRFLAPHLKMRISHHTKTLRQTSPRHWPHYIHECWRDFRALLRERRAMVNSPMRSPPPSSNHYYLLGTRFVPRRVRVKVCLLTPSSRPVAVFWKYLTKSDVRVIPLRSHHVDAFAPANLESFLAAFRQGSAGDTPNAKNGPEVR